MSLLNYAAIKTLRSLPSIALSSAQAECNCTGDAPSGVQPFKIDSFMRRSSVLQIPGMWNVWN